jgi:hypothetical protein
MIFFIWSFRIIVYSLAVYLSFTYIVPIGSAGVYLAGPVASLAIIGDLLLSARMKKTDVASEVAKRIMVADRVLNVDRWSLGSGNDRDRLDPGPSYPELDSEPDDDEETKNKKIS